ncbi:DUF1531-domain-containing protein [Aaosphaeria arxii CBS 175.79]|uniref:DUF1531-domain-containing protein n=1 Tax=Aaosphaeria arxii CBS 175.79 TaxID=1450172 RepID=A0A6A5XW84_9PLEO|nr:DUF1531-domain-containing protein [Aaosphaeria arxii CBS 175.79]KAF2017097.1 DUF1531-domain-containing protein [Aaosphaeria arxii CBS 175.79]
MSLEGESIGDTLSRWGGNLTRNTSAAFTDLRPKDYIRLVIIVGTYSLIRPWLVKLGQKLQTKAHENDAAETGEISANELRGKIEIPGVGDSDEDEEEEAKPGDWGRNARVRQRKFVREALQKEEDRLRDEQADESDKEIEQFLVD